MHVCVHIIHSYLLFDYLSGYTSLQTPYTNKDTSSNFQLKHHLLLHEPHKHEICWNPCINFVWWSIVHYNHPLLNPIRPWCTDGSYSRKTSLTVEPSSIPENKERWYGYHVVCKLKIEQQYKRGLTCGALVLFIQLVERFVHAHNIHTYVVFLGVGY